MARLFKAEREGLKSRDVVVYGGAVLLLSSLLTEEEFLPRAAQEVCVVTEKVRLHGEREGRGGRQKEKKNSRTRRKEVEVKEREGSEHGKFRRFERHID